MFCEQFRIMPWELDLLTYEQWHAFKARVDQQQRR